MRATQVYLGPMKKTHAFPNYEEIRSQTEGRFIYLFR